MHSQRTAKVEMKDSPPVMNVLLRERSIETVSVAQGIDIGGSRSLAQHLDDRIPWDEMNQQEDNGDYNPEHRERNEEAAHRPPDGRRGHCVASLLSSS